MTRNQVCGANKTGDSHEFASTSVLILVGGKGTRLKAEVNDRPKPLAEIDGHPFLDRIIEHASRCGLKRFVLCTGYMGDLIEQYCSKANEPSRLVFSRETRPLGTAGAVKNAERLIESDPFIVMNGDSLCLVDLREFYEFHRHKEADVSMVVARMDETGDYGTLAVSDTGRVEGYRGEDGEGTFCERRHLLHE